MKKVQTLTLALALVALGSVSWAATSFNSSRNMQKGPETTASNLNLSKSNINRLPGKVTRVDEKDKTFDLTVTFSAEKMKGDISRDAFKVGDTIDVTYTQTPGGPMATPSCCTSSSKSDSSDRVAPDNASLKLLNGEVTEVNNQAKTFTVTLHFSTVQLSRIPTVGEIFDITSTQTPDGRIKMISCRREITDKLRLCAQGIQKAQSN